MNGALNALRQGVAEQLRTWGLNAVTAMEPDRAGRWREPVVAVSLSRVKCAPGGFQDYLGVRTEGGTARELYGREVELTLSLDIYAPRQGGESACQQTLAAMTESLICKGAAGLTALDIQAEQVEFAEKLGLYRQAASCRCRAWLVATADEGGSFVDFEVKGRKR